MNLNNSIAFAVVMWACAVCGRGLYIKPTGHTYLHRLCLTSDTVNFIVTILLWNLAQVVFLLSVVMVHCNLLFQQYT